MVKDGVERAPRRDRGTRLLHSTKPRERNAQIKIWHRIIPVGLDRASRPRDSLLVMAEEVIRPACEVHPDASQRIARAEAKGLDNVRLRLFGATAMNLAHSDIGMSMGEISIERQGVFAMGDALRSALGSM